MAQLIEIGKGLLTWKANPPHSHTAWEIVYYLGGKGVTSGSGKSIPFRKGLLVLYPPGIVHEETAHGNYESLWMKFLRFPGGPGEMLALEDDRQRTFGNIVDLIYRAHHRPGWERRMEAALDLLLTMIRENNQSRERSPHVDTLENRLIDHIHTPGFVFKKAFADLGVSHHHLIRIFKKATGQSPVNYLIDLRLKEARRFLSGTGFSIREIAHLLGFGDPYYFSRLFKKKTGHSPKAFRLESQSGR